MKFLDVFNPIVKGSHGLTDEAIYSSIRNGGEMIPLYGGNSQHSFTERYISEKTKTVDGTEALVFSGEGIVISLDGSAGCMTYKTGEKFSLNHHAGFITVKKTEKDRVNLRYFALFMQNHYKSLSVSDGSKTLSLNQIYTDDFSLPEKAIQDRIVNSMSSFMPKIEQLYSIYEKINSLIQKQLAINYKQYQKRGIEVDECIEHDSGNTGLTEEFIYSTLLIPGERYKVKSSSTSEETLLGYVPQCQINKSSIKINNRLETLLVARNGNAGQTEYIVNEQYAINDHAYILYVKKDCPYKINLKWFAIQYRSDFLSYSSSSANGTWNMSGFFENVVIDIPDYEEQLEIVRLYEKAEQLKGKIDYLTNKFSKLLNKEIC